MDIFFDYHGYISNYPDLKFDIKHALSHFRNHGLLEKRTYNNLKFHNFNPKQQKIILFTNARDEENIKEWCAHHLLLGFDCIYIFDNLSIKSIAEELYFFEKVCVFDIKETGFIKLKCIKFAIEIAKSVNADYMLYLDADEFLILNKHETVSDFLNDYQADLISINWLMFGTNGFKKQPDGIISNFTKCERYLNNHVKTFVKPSKITKIFTPHTYYVKENSISMDINKNILIPSPFVENKVEFNLTPAYIAHYIYQSEEMCNFRKMNRKNDLGGSNGNVDILLYNEVDNFEIKERYSSKINTFLNNLLF